MVMTIQRRRKDSKGVSIGRRDPMVESMMILEGKRGHEETATTMMMMKSV